MQQQSVSSYPPDPGQLSHSQLIHIAGDLSPSIDIHWRATENRHGPGTQRFQSVGEGDERKVTIVPVRDR